MHRKNGTIEINVAELYYEVFGEGPPLVFVPAGIADGRMWETQAAAFAPHYLTIRHDMRASGGPR